MMDYGKEKFGGPFTQEEVEDVKTPTLASLGHMLEPQCVTLESSMVNLFNDDNQMNLSIWVLSQAISDWLFPVLLIPLYQLLLYRCFRSCSPSMLRCIGTGLFMCILGVILLFALGVVGVVVSDDVQRYLSCTAQADNATNLGNQMEWYWKLYPYVLYGIGKTIAVILVYQLIIAQSPDKMKGLVIGILVAFRGIVVLASIQYPQLMYTLCWDLPIPLVLVVLFVVFLVLSKHYTLRERNREINIQAIVEEHYERYMDQEEEYMRQQHY